MKNIKRIFITALIFITAFITFTHCSWFKSYNYDKYQQNLYQPVTENTVNLSDHISQLNDKIRKKTGVYVIEEGDISLISRAWLCEASEKSIDIQYFIFSPDNVGIIALDYLLRAADRGVHIRMLVDDFMVDTDIDILLSLNAHPHFEIKVYNPNSNIGKHLPEKILNMAIDFRGVNQRMHNKTFIVDSTVVITGGRNVADEYFDYDHEYNFRDRDVMLLGEAVKDINFSFKLFWESDLSIPVQKLVVRPVSQNKISKIYNYIHGYAEDPENFWPQVRSKINTIPDAFEYILESGSFVWCDSVVFISDIPGKNSGDNGLKGGGLCTDSLVSLIKQAEFEICIQTPYLVTTEKSMNLLKEALNRGVGVKILTNSLSSTDNLEAFSGYKRDRSELVDIGIEVYEYRPDAEIRRKIMTSDLQKKINYAPIFGLHAKSMVIDGKIAVIGTFNLDPRSTNLNTECIAVIFNEKIAECMKNIMLEELRPQNSWKVTNDFNPDPNAGWTKRFKVWIRRIVPKAIL